MSESANKLVAGISTEDSTPDTTDATVEEEVEQEDHDEVTEPEESTEEDALPDNIKEILQKNRKEVREANARAIAAEKALAAKDAPAAPEPTETESRFKELFIASTAKTALVEAGITTGTDRFLKMLDLSSVEVDDSGSISGLAEQIESLKEEFKDILSPKPARKSTGNVDGARREAPPVPQSSADKLAGYLK